MTNALLKNGDGSVLDIEVVNGSHVYLHNGDSERFIGWGDLTADAKERCLQVQERVNGAFEDARKDLSGIL